ncbi:MAG: methionine adenosyltransferase [Chloroflexi bacterium]|nr:methionine adenosyltransferase [Chloroflexota bacterium]
MPENELTFFRSPQYFLTSESVTEGHPDKACDQISDAVLDAALAADPNSRVACEVATKSNIVFVFGEITTQAKIDYEAITRQTLREIGYTSAEMGIDADHCQFYSELKEQEPEIGSGVDIGGAGDQGMMIGFACDETPEFMPLSLSLAHRLTRRLAQSRKSGELVWLRPDAKSQVTVEYAAGRPKRIDTILISTQHDPGISQEFIEGELREHVIASSIDAHLIDEATRIIVNPTGSFVIGGPAADAGLTGRKIIVDTYGGVARHGGGAFSGKDPSKVDRSAAYMARYIAKNIVAAGLARRFELQVSYAIGVVEPTSLALETFGTGAVSDARLEALIREHFDLRPNGIIEQLDLRRPIYRKVAAYGHFGRDDVPWEATDQAENLRRDAGI